MCLEGKGMLNCLKQLVGKNEKITLITTFDKYVIDMSSDKTEVTESYVTFLSGKQVYCIDTKYILGFCYIPAM